MPSGQDSPAGLARRASSIRLWRTANWSASAARKSGTVCGLGRRIGVEDFRRDLSVAEVIPREPRQARQQHRRLPDPVQNPSGAHQVQDASLLEPAMKLAGQRVYIDSDHWRFHGPKRRNSSSACLRSSRSGASDLVGQTAQQVRRPVSKSRLPKRTRRRRQLRQRRRNASRFISGGGS